MAAVLTAIAVILFIVFVIGIIGNAVVLFVLLRQRSTWSITTTYLFNLALADALFICFVPFWGHYYLSEYNWSFGVGMCKLTSVVTSVNMYGSVFFLTAMSVDRWMAVVHATSVNIFRTSVVARWVCVSVWCAALILTIPRLIFQQLAVFSLNTTRESESGEVDSTLAPNVVVTCALYMPSNYSNKEVVMGSLEFIHSTVGFVIPMIVICICYMKIVMTVKHKVISKRVRKDRVANLAALIITAFFVCWLPFHVMNLFSATVGWWTDLPFNESLFNKIKPFFIALAYANSCINPIVYAFTTTNFQENIKDMCGSDDTRPYKMTVGHPAIEDKQNGNSGHKAKDEATLGPHVKHPRPKEKQNIQVHVQAHQGESSNLRPQAGTTCEGQSFSYYSCPAVMQGLGKANNECMVDVESAAAISTPDARNFEEVEVREAVA